MDDYLAGVPEEARATLEKLRKSIKAAARFPAGKPLPAALVRKLVKARIDENEPGRT